MVETYEDHVGEAPPPNEECFVRWTGRFCLCQRVGRSDLGNIVIEIDVVHFVLFLHDGLQTIRVGAAVMMAWRRSSPKKDLLCSVLRHRNAGLLFSGDVATGFSETWHEKRVDECGVP